MGWWKADPPSEPFSQSAAPSSSPPQTPRPSFPNDKTSSSCPVDPKTRDIWLQHAKAQNSDSRSLPPKHPHISSTPAKAFTSSPTAQCSSDTISQSPSTVPPPSSRSTERHLSHDRVISSIPRAFPYQPSSTSTSQSNPPSNSETETGPHPSGYWIYPSEHQFFTAVLRKHNPSSLLSSPSSNTTPINSSSTGEAQAGSHLASTIPSIIPIHNAVNERAWALVKNWEGPFYPNNSNLTTTTILKSKAALPCTGPRLLSFRGLGSGPSPSPPDSGISGLLRDYISLLNPTTPLTPKARFNAFLGYQAPFDRHDWKVQRCDGREVEYVIDFYQGRAPTPPLQQPGGLAGRRGGKRKEVDGFGSAGGGVNFYLDVRPKLNSWEGWRTRGLGVWRGFWDDKDGRPKGGG